MPIMRCKLLLESVLAVLLLLVATTETGAAFQQLSATKPTDALTELVSCTSLVPTARIRAFTCVTFGSCTVQQLRLF